MKIALLSSGNSIHTVRLANGLVERGIFVHLVSMHGFSELLDSRVICYDLKIRSPQGYLFNVFQLRNLLQRIDPDLLNVHYASGYGLLARLTAFQPTLLSLWGSDVYSFPNRSSLHRWILRGNIEFAKAVASTSNCMARKVSEVVVHHRVYITPFGVDEEQFFPLSSDTRGSAVVLGTVKTLEYGYGIDVLIRAFSLVLSNLGYPNDIFLEITGDGTQRKDLENLVLELGISPHVRFNGVVDHRQVPGFLHRLDIYCAMSREESFGVAILEASSCGLPVIVSDADGPIEVTVNNVTGLVVPKDNVEATANAMLSLVLNSKLRLAMGRAGRAHVLKNYTWQRSLDTIIAAYEETIST